MPNYYRGKYKGPQKFVKKIINRRRPDRRLTRLLNDLESRWQDATDANDELNTALIDIGGILSELREYDYLGE